MNRTTVALALVLIGVAMLTWAVWQMQGQIVSVTESVVGLEEIERARRAKRRIPK